jgi:hypothetical protein
VPCSSKTLASLGESLDGDEGELIRDDVHHFATQFRAGQPQGQGGCAYLIQTHRVLRLACLAINTLLHCGLCPWVYSPASNDMDPALNLALSTESNIRRYLLFISL